ncbi:MAG TPA: Ni/Fe hydrogenase subunit alpha [Acidobacteriaceae bacterium]|nr:Ni/Fe hydrogenase subunit alpha [Acidobacteriaceae bacterium]
MSRTIVIDPVTRLEGHGKITLQLDEAGIVQDATFHVTQLRGFEKFCEGRPFYEMPNITARVCGICPVSHLIASSKACDAILAVQIPPVAADLRRILNLAQLIQSHALSFFYLSSPDLLLGMDANPEERSILHVAHTHPQIGADGVALRQFGQRIIEMLAGKRIHPGWTVPGGVNEPLSEEKRDQILALIPPAVTAIQRTLLWFKDAIQKFSAEIEVFANFPTLFMGLIDDRGLAEYYDGHLRVIDSEGNIIAGELDPARYQEFIGEAVEPYTYMKFPYYRPLGYPGGTYRVGPLARLNLAGRCDTPLADQEWRAFRNLSPRPLLSSFYYHYARLIEMLYATEKIEALLADRGILDKHVRATASVNNLEGVGVAEAPRGTLIHHYKVDENGLITWANLIIATGHNNGAMNRGILQAARHYVQGDQVKEGMLNRVEAVVRTFDPCLSCSTHAMGRMPLSIELRAADGSLVREVRRG